MLNATQAKKLRDQNDFIVGLTRYEDTALSMCRPIDLAALRPELIDCPSGPNAAVAAYWRVVLSSEKQSRAVSGGYRQNVYMVRDKTSGAFLGIFALSDPPTHDQGIDGHIQWDKGVKNEHQHRVTMLRRCLPIYEFGDMLGGKLLALSAMSREIIRTQEIKFSFQYWWLFVRTLHGKSSQYNRLNQKGLIDLGVDSKGFGLYCKELRKNANAHIQNGKQVGGTTTEPFEDLFEWWKTRWLHPRMESKSVTVIQPDPETYRLSNMLLAKMKTPYDVLGAQSIAPDDRE